MEHMLTFSGNIIHGEKKARKLGFPTANIDIESGQLPEGVYAARAVIDNLFYKGALVVMHTPSKVEIHLLDISDTDLYGKRIHVAIVEKVNGIEVYGADEESALKEKITADIQQIKSVFARY